MTADVIPFRLPVAEQHSHDEPGADAADVARQIAKIESSTGWSVSVLRDFGAYAYVQIFDAFDPGGDTWHMWVISARIRDRVCSRRRR